MGRRSVKFNFASLLKTGVHLCTLCFKRDANLNFIDLFFSKCTPFFRREAKLNFTDLLPVKVCSFSLNMNDILFDLGPSNKYPSV